MLKRGSRVEQLRRCLPDEEGFDPGSEAGARRMEAATKGLLLEMVDELLSRRAAYRYDLTLPDEQLDAMLAREIELAGGEDA